MRRFEVVQNDVSGMWHWRLIDEHNRVVAVSQISSDSPLVCEASIRRLGPDFSVAPINTLKQII